jgi:hypothetical protein
MSQDPQVQLAYHLLHLQPSFPSWVSPSSQVYLLQLQLQVQLQQKNQPQFLPVELLDPEQRLELQGKM